MNEIVALIGMPGAGKTSVGRILARKFGVPFEDIDSVIEQNAGVSVERIFLERGEGYFRVLETTVFQRAAAYGGGKIISCGGGLAVNPINAAILEKSCFCVYLRASVQTLLGRVGSGEGRPLLAGDSRAKLSSLLSEREPIYSKAADCVVDCDGLSVEETAEKVAEIIKDL